MIKQYAVVRSDVTLKFSKLHSSMEEALEEAKRLCRKEQATFLILQTVGHVEPDVRPVKVVTYD